MPNVAVKDVLVQSDVEGKRGKWIAKIQEYDLDTKTTKLVLPYASFGKPTMKSMLMDFQHPDSTVRLASG